MLLKQLQEGEFVVFPDSKAMPNVGKRCHELRISDKSLAWRIMYRIDEDAIVVAEVFSKKTRKTPDSVIERCRHRFSLYDENAA